MTTLTMATPAMDTLLWPHSLLQHSPWLYSLKVASEVAEIQAKEAAKLQAADATALGATEATVYRDRRGKIIEGASQMEEAAKGGKQEKVKPQPDLDPDSDPHPLPVSLITDPDPDPTPDPNQVKPQWGGGLAQKRTKEEQRDYEREVSRTLVSS